MGGVKFLLYCARDPCSSAALVAANSGDREKRPARAEPRRATSGQRRGQLVSTRFHAFPRVQISKGRKGRTRNHATDWTSLTRPAVALIRRAPVRFKCPIQQRPGESAGYTVFA